jgi:hypothetical protein
MKIKNNEIQWKVNFFDFKDNSISYPGVSKHSRLHWLTIFNIIKKS